MQKAGKKTRAMSKKLIFGQTYLKFAVVVDISQPLKRMNE